MLHNCCDAVTDVTLDCMVFTRVHLALKRARDLEPCGLASAEGVFHGYDRHRSANWTSDGHVRSGDLYHRSRRAVLEGVSITVACVQGLLWEFHGLSSTSRSKEPKPRMLSFATTEWTGCTAANVSRSSSKGFLCMSSDRRSFGKRARSTLTSSTAALLSRVPAPTTRVRTPQTYARRSASVSADLGPWFRRWQRWQEPNGRGRSTKLRSLKFQRRRMLTAKFSSIDALEADATTKEAAFEKD